MKLTLSQLASIRYEHNSRGQVLIESKEDARKRGVKSPDRAEAVMLAFAADRMEWFRAYARLMGERRRHAAEGEAQGKPPLLGDGKAIDSYERFGAELRRLAGLDEEDEE